MACSNLIALTSLRGGFVGIATSLGALRSPHSTTTFAIDILEHVAESEASETPRGLLTLSCALSRRLVSPRPSHSRSGGVRILTLLGTGRKLVQWVDEIGIR